MREQIRQQRRALTKNQQAHASDCIAKALASWPILQQAQTVASFHPVNGEINTLPLLLKLAEQDKCCYLPRVVPDTFHMDFVRYNADTKLQKNTWHIPEPIGDELCPAETLDVVIAPCVAVDDQCHRLGMGGGFYDRLFAFKQKNARKPFLLGVVYDFQQVPLLTPQPWDVLLDGVLIAPSDPSVQGTQLILCDQNTAHDQNQCDP